MWSGVCVCGILGMRLRVLHHTSRGSLWCRVACRVSAQDVAEADERNRVLRRRLAEVGIGEISMAASIVDRKTNVVCQWSRVKESMRVVRQQCLAIAQWATT